MYLFKFKIRSLKCITKLELFVINILELKLFLVLSSCISISYTLIIFIIITYFHYLHRQLMLLHLNVYILFIKLQYYIATSIYHLCFLIIIAKSFIQCQYIIGIAFMMLLILFIFTQIFSFLTIQMQFQKWKKILVILIFLLDFSLIIN